MGDPRHACKCSPQQVEKYLARISGPLLDRIDLHIEVPSVPYKELAALTDGVSSAVMREQVYAARAIQANRFGSAAGGLNSRMSPKDMRKYATPDADGQSLLQAAMEDLGLSARAHDRILRTARTIADLEAATAVTGGHVAEAIGFRTLDRKLWDKK